MDFYRIAPAVPLAPPLSIEYPFPRYLLEDQSSLYSALGLYFLDRYGSPLESPCPPLYTDDAEGHGAWAHGRLLMKNRFWTSTVPSIQYTDYLTRIAKSMPKLETTVLLALPIYARRLQEGWSQSLQDSQHPQYRPGGLEIGLNVIHRLTITMICLGSKALGDQYYSNPFCSVVGGISGRELHGLELELSARLGWSLQCSQDDYAWSWAQLEAYLR